MTIKQESTFPRRKFLKGTLGALGASLVGLGPVSALAKLAPSRAVTLAVWNGSHFVPANQLPSGDSTLNSVQIAMSGFNSVGGPIKAIETIFVVPTNTSKLQTPFTAWVAPPVGASHVKFVQAVDPVSGILLKLELSDSSGSTATTSRLISGSGVGNKLRVGTYVLMDGVIDMNQFTFDPANKLQPLSRILGSGAVPQYVVIDIARV